MTPCPFCHKPLDKNHNINDDRKVVERAMMDLQQMKEDDQMQ